MKRQTAVLATYGNAREHAHGECMDVVRHELGMLVLETRSNSHIDVGRSLLACHALAHGSDALVFIDHDVLFNPLDVERIADAARETGGIVGAPYSQRKMGAGIVGSFRQDTEEVTFFEGGGLYEAQGVIGMGFTAISSSVFEKLNALPEYAETRSQEGLLRPYFKKLIVDGYWLMEDASFCHAARQVGASTMLDTRIRVKHLGQHPFGIEDCRYRPTEEPSLRMRVKAKI